MTIDILIPTYNRIRPLIKNLEILNNIITDLQDFNFRIIISDNASTDGTDKVIKDFISEKKSNISYSLNEKNLGFTVNVLNLVSKSTSDYIILLGDDDYLSAEYLRTALKTIEENPEITCVLPAFEAISETGERLGSGRDLDLPSRLYDKGIDNVIQNSHKAHQISGIILKREGLYEVLVERDITNLYPQIFMTAFSCLHGDCLQITEYPVLVTQTLKKAWSYNDVGLINDIFQNYSALDLDDKSQYRLEKKLLKNQRWRALRYWKNPIKQLNVIRKIANGKYTSQRGHFFLPFILIGYWIKTFFQALKNKIVYTCQSSKN